MVKWLEFHILLQLINPKVDGHITIAHLIVSKKVHNLQLSQKDIIQKRLQSILISIYLSVNIWTSLNNHLLLAICGHFINSQEKLINALLSLRTVASHSGDEQQNTLLLVLKDYGITRKLGAVISNNYTANDKLCRIISDWLLQKEGIK